MLVFLYSSTWHRSSEEDRSSTLGLLATAALFSSEWSLSVLRRTVKRVDLIEAVYREAPVTKEFASDLVDQVIEAICSSLEQGENVKISGFGTFTVRDKAERVGRNPKTGVLVPIEPRRSVSFTASQVLKAHMNQPSSPKSGSDRKGAALPVEDQHEPQA
jgi:integration host factor subunit alpha